MKLLEEAATVTLHMEKAVVSGRVAVISSHVLALAFSPGEAPKDGARFSAATLRFDARHIELGRCQFHAHPKHPLRRAGDRKAPPGDGTLTTLDEILDFDKLVKKGVVTSLTQRIEQLPLILSRRNGIQPELAALVDETIYDLQVLRSAFDGIDRGIEHELPNIKESVRETVLRTHYATFAALFDEKLHRLEGLVADFSREAHEQHGFYLRKQAWDLILSSKFLARTNGKPRGYAGDSAMLRMIYENEPIGPTIFSRCLHHHPLQSAAAQAVRQRLALVSEWISQACARHPGKVSVTSVACGPALELAQLTDPTLLGRLRLTLLDQDAEALREARLEARATEKRLAAPLDVRFERHSVRRMLQNLALNQELGGQNLIYAMGLFDYLTAPVARAVTRGLFSLLAPGGELVISNFHGAHKSRVYMEYWMDWALYYRDEKEMAALGEGLDAATLSVSFDASRSQMFLRLRKKD